MYQDPGFCLTLFLCLFKCLGACSCWYLWAGPVVSALGALLLLVLLHDVVECTLLQQLQHLSLGVRQLAVVLDAILFDGRSYENGPLKGVALASMVLERGKQLMGWS